MTSQQQDRKNGVAQAPFDEVEETLKTDNAKLDYSGAKEKTDPREIALVRKLDLWIMPVLWLMYWLNYLVSSSILRACHGTPLS